MMCTWLWFLFFLALFLLTLPPIQFGSTPRCWSDAILLVFFFIFLLSLIELGLVFFSFWIPMHQRLFFAWVASFITFLVLKRVQSIWQKSSKIQILLLQFILIGIDSPVISFVVTCTVRGSGTGSLLRSTFHSPKE